MNRCSYVNKPGYMLEHPVYLVVLVRYSLWLSLSPRIRTVTIHPVRTISRKDQRAFARPYKAAALVRRYPQRLHARPLFEADDIVRTPWRHREPDGNDLAGPTIVGLVTILNGPKVK